MTRTKRRAARAIGAREATAIAGNLGRDLRKTLNSTKAQSGRARRQDRESVRLRSARSREGRGAPNRRLRPGSRSGIALGRPLAVGFSRDVADPGAEGGRRPSRGPGGSASRLPPAKFQNGRTARFELPTRPANPAHSVDVGEIDLLNRVLILIEICFPLDDIGAADPRHRSKGRRGGSLDPGPRQPAPRRELLDPCRTPAANREIVRRYPAILRSRFRGSSADWNRVLTDGSAPPAEPGIVWADTRVARLVALRLRDE